MNRFLVIFFLLILALSGNAQRKKKKLIKPTTINTVLVNGIITSTESYCGGAPPPSDLLAELNTPKPIVQIELFIRKDVNDISKPILYTVTTDDKGQFSITLPVGNYVVVDSRKKDKVIYNQTLEKYKVETNNTSAIDIECYKQYIKEPDFYIKVTSSSKQPISISHNYHKKCDWAGAPCVEYRGPLPQ